MGQDDAKLEGLSRLLAGVDKTYASLPRNLRLEVQKVTRGLPEFGPRLLRRAGPGMEFFDQRDYNPEIHERRQIDARLTARAGIDLYSGLPREIAVLKEAEIRQRIYFWRKAMPTMDFASAALSKKAAAEIMMIAMAKHLARNEEMIGVLDGKGAYRGGNVHQHLTRHLYDVSILTGDEPLIRQRMPANSVCVLFDDGIAPQSGQEPMTTQQSLAIFEKKLARIVRPNLQLYMVMVIDPQEIDFNFDSHHKFNGLAGDGSIDFNVASDVRDNYRQKIADYIRQVRQICDNHRVKFILQRTDDPLQNALLSIYGVRSAAPDLAPRVGKG